MAIEVGVEPQTLAIAPGERGQFTVTLRNTGAAAVHERVVVSAEVADWAWVSPPDVDIGPGETVRVGLAWVRVPGTPP